eukprot:403340388
MVLILQDSRYQLITEMAESVDQENLFAILQPSFTIVMFDSKNGEPKKAYKMLDYGSEQVEMISNAIAGYSGQQDKVMIHSQTDQINNSHYVRHHFISDPEKVYKYVETNVGSPINGFMIIKKVISDAYTILSCIEYDQTVSLLSTQRTQADQPFSQSRFLQLVLSSQILMRQCQDIKLYQRENIRLLTLEKKEDNTQIYAYFEVQVDT